MNSQRSLLRCFEGAEFIFVGRTIASYLRINGSPSYLIYMFAKLKDGRNIYINNVEFRTKHFILVDDPTDLASFKANMDYLWRHVHVHAGEETTRQICEKYENDIFNRDYLNFDFDVFDCDVKKLYEIMDQREIG